MNDRAPWRVTTLLVVFSLLAQVCVGTTAGAAGGGGNAKAAAPPAKVSQKLRERLRRAGAQTQAAEAAQTAEVILQLKGKPTGRLNSLLNRSGVRIRSKHDSFDTLALDSR